MQRSPHPFRITIVLAILAAGLVAGGSPRAGSKPTACGLVPTIPSSDPLVLKPIPERGASDFRVVNRFHIVRRADGSGGADENLIPLMMRDLNYGFRDTPFVFVREPGVVYIDNDTFYADFPNVLDQIDLVNIGYEPGVLSWYITPVITGSLFNAGTWVGPPFTTGLRGILMSYGATGRPGNIVTPTHEAGHIFQLAHPYETVFGVECVSGVNCVTAGDRICDTPASPIIFSANTTGTGIYFANQLGPCAGDPVFQPNTRLYMEAGWTAGHILRDRFTDGQVQRMLAEAEGLQQDLFGPARPDILVDCNNNSIDDIDEILSNPGLDPNRDMVPDACQVFPAPDDLIVAGMNSDPFNRPRYYDGRTGAWRGDLWNGMTWTHQLRFGPDGLIYMPRLTLVERLDVRTGRTVDNFIDGVLEGAGVFVDLLFASGRILVLDNASANIRRYSGFNGTFQNVFANLAAGGMSSPKYMEYGPDGNIYVVGNGNLGNTVQMVDRSTGALLGSFISPGAGGLGSGQGLVFHTDGKLYVSNGAANNILTYNALTGAYTGAFVSSNSGGLNNPHSLRFGPDGHLYVASRGTNSVKRYHGASGGYLGDFVTSGSGGSPGTGNLVQPAGLLFCEGPDGIDDLTLTEDSGTTTLTWSAPQVTGAPLLVYDTLGSITAGDFTGAGSFCVEADDASDTASTHVGVPQSGEVLFFMVRPENVCGKGPLGAASAGTRTAGECVL